mgnify:CR=1 FL=1
MAKKKVNIPETYAALAAVNAKIAALKEKIKVLEAEADVYEADLILAIPENALKDGVYHKAWDKPSISYGKALERVKEVLIPKAKQAAVDLIVEEFTSHKTMHSISIPKEKV